MLEDVFLKQIGASTLGIGCAKPQRPTSNPGFFLCFDANALGTGHWYDGGKLKSKMARRSKQLNVLKIAWEWAESTEPGSISQANIETVYRVGVPPCSEGQCRLVVRKILLKLCAHLGNVQPILNSPIVIG